MVFDLDGVLVMSEHLWEEAWLDYASAPGVRWSADDTRRCQGMSVRGMGHVSGRSHEHDDDAGRHRRGHRLTSSRAYDAGEVSLVDGARRAGPAVAARVPGRARLVRADDASSIRSWAPWASGAWFGATVSSAEVAAGKPSPDVYLEAMRRLGIVRAAASRSRTPATASGRPRRRASRCSPCPTRRTRWRPTRRRAADSIHASLDGVGRRLLALLDRRRHGGPR